MLQIHEIINTLYKRQEELDNAIEIAEKMQKDLPEGKLRINRNHGTMQYYLITDKNDTCGKYIKKKNNELIRRLAQRDYADKLQKMATVERSEISKMIGLLESFKHSGNTTAEMLFSSMNKERQKLIDPILISDDEYATLWEKAEYPTNKYNIEEKVYITKKGDKVRSKSEVMLADMYYDLGIPYRYEAEIELYNGKRVYPDFTLLSVKERKEIYHEHMGLLDDDEYRFHNLRKIEEYRKSGIFIGKNLLITYEAAGCPINIREFEKSISWLFDLSDKQILKRG